jgi:hypothetical protein
VRHPVNKLKPRVGRLFLVAEEAYYAIDVDG